MEPALASQRVLVGEEVAGSAVGVSLLTQLHQTSELSRPPVPDHVPSFTPRLLLRPGVMKLQLGGRGAGPGTVPSLCRGPMPRPFSSVGGGAEAVGQARGCRPGFGRSVALWCLAQNWCGRLCTSWAAPPVQEPPTLGLTRLFADARPVSPVTIVHVERKPCFTLVEASKWAQRGAFLRPGCGPFSSTNHLLSLL